jgi:hypothetical protein
MMERRASKTTPDSAWRAALIDLKVFHPRDLDCVFQSPEMKDMTDTALHIQRRWSAAPRREKRPRPFLLGLLTLILLAPGPAAAQQKRVPDVPHEGLLVSFYNDPRPDRLVGYLSTFGKTSRNWDAYPALVGFFAVVFRTHPDWIDRLLPAECDSNVAEAIAAALRLAGKAAIPASIQTCLGPTASDSRLKAELAGLPSRLEDLRILKPTHLDILWGASFASGEARYPLMIAEYFAQTANRSEPIAIDVAMTSIAFSGGPRDIIGQLRGKYGDALAREIVFAATALWALRSNAQRHTFVDKVVATYIDEHPGTYATKALSVVRPAPSRP